MYINLNNIQETAYYGVTSANQFIELGWKIDLDDTGKYPRYTVYDPNGNDIFAAENIDGLEPWMILECDYHHVAYSSDYVSVYSAGKFAPYHGRYGEGYTVTINDEKIKRCFKFYYIKQGRA